MSVMRPRRCCTPLIGLQGWRSGYDTLLFHSEPPPHIRTDGSIMAHTADEITDPANNGLDDIIEAQRPFAIKHNVSFGDLYVHLGGIQGSSCTDAVVLASSSPALLAFPTATLPLRSHFSQAVRMTPSLPHTALSPSRRTRSPTSSTVSAMQASALSSWCGF